MTSNLKAVTNIIFAGVGGQGSVVASHLLAEAAVKDGLRVKLAETYGAATRGGSVLSHVRLGEAWVPITPVDEADVVVAMEPLEGLRVGRRFLKPRGWALINTQTWLPVDVTEGRMAYPSLGTILEDLRKLGAEVLPVDATALAMKAGSDRAANSVMLGALFALGLLRLSTDRVFQAMADRWPGKLVEVNRSAFNMGFQFAAHEQRER